MVYRVYVEKKPGLQNEADQVLDSAHKLLGLSNLEKVRLVNRYDLDQVEEEIFNQSIGLVLSEVQTDQTYKTLDQVLSQEKGEARILAVESLPGQYDQRADSAAQCIQMMSQKERPRVRAAKLFLFYGDLDDEDMEKLKKLLINPVETREASLAMPENLDWDIQEPSPVPILEGFRDLSFSGLKELWQDLSLAMDMDDLAFIQSYFKKENRDPSMTEIRILDTYWSDHCRHTTFLTHIDDVEFEDENLKTSWASYLETRKALGDEKPISLMDLGTIAAKALEAEGRLRNLDKSKEINACTVKVNLTVDGKKEPWLLFFKNETHNHPTEIEPFGGAATCIGGAIRDPLSGRAYVYGAMRLTGAGDPTKPLDETLPGKLPQYTIVREAARGYSSYGNQIGVPTGIVDEVYHPGYEAKRMEVGAVIGAAPAKNVVREEPQPGDLVVLLGGRTGRDGIGGATGSSKSQNIESVQTAGAEVQKGDAPEERRLQRFFRHPQASRMIKRCNDFGAGGVSVAIGELADGVYINLDKVPKKYEGLDGTELAISESQERMATVIAPENREDFLQIAHEENLEATVVAEVTESPRMVMDWRGETIVDLDRDFLNSNGAEKHTKIRTGQMNYSREGLFKPTGFFEKDMDTLLSNLNTCSKEGLIENFDSTVGGLSILMPLGGKYQKTPIQAMVHKFPVEKGESPDVSLMSWGYDPYLSERNPYLGAYMAVVQSMAKLVATGTNRRDAYLTFQEYFPNPGNDPDRWGLPLASLLGAYQAQMDLAVGAIGGKDSMSGSFENMDVPPTLISFAVTTDHWDHILSPEFKGANHTTYLLRPYKRENGLPSPDSLITMFDYINSLNLESSLASAWAIGKGGIAEAAFNMAIGNRVGCHLNSDIPEERLFELYYGSIFIEMEDDKSLDPLLDGPFQVVPLGHTLAEPIIEHRGVVLDLEDLEKVHQDRLENIYPKQALHQEVIDKEPVRTLNFDQKAKIKPVHILETGKPRVLIPVFPGTNTEYESARYAELAGCEAEVFVLKNKTAEDIQWSVDQFAHALDDSQILFLPGGFSGGDEPDGSAKFLTSFLRNPEIAEKIESLVHEKRGLVLGICNGFQALIKLGLLPFGHIKQPKSNWPTLAMNAIGRHQSRLARVRVASSWSPWLACAPLGKTYLQAVSHGEGRFLCPDKDLLNEIIDRGLVTGQYVDYDGEASMKIDHNPNGSDFAIEGLCSVDGNILGKMGHSERAGQGLYQNIPGDQDMKLFKAAVKYFTEQ